jgi:hypothetical protein
MSAGVWRFQVLAVLSFFLVSACAAEDACQPGSYDGAWRAKGALPPNVEEIRKGLIGMTRGTAEEFMGVSSVERLAEKGAHDSVSYWTYQSAKELTYRSCESADRISYRQDIFWVRAVFLDNKVISCSMGIKGSISDRTRSVDEILASPPAPLDQDFQDCVPAL